MSDYGSFDLWVAVGRKRAQSSEEIIITHIGPHALWPNRAETGVRLFRKFLSALVDTGSKNLDKTALSRITPAQLMRKAATVRDTQVSLRAKMPMEFAMGRRPRDLMDPASMNPEQVTSTPTKQDLLNEDIHMLATKTQLEVQQREDIRRDPADGMKCAPPDLRVGEHVFYWQEDPSKIQQGRTLGKWLKVRLLLSVAPLIDNHPFVTVF